MPSSPDVGELGALLDDHRHLVEEPRIDPGRRVDVVDRDAPMQQLADLLDAVGGGNRRHGEQLVVGQRVELLLGRIAVEPEAALFQRAQRLLQTLGEGPADRHHLADRLHLGAEHPGRARAASRTPSGGSS